MLVSAFATSTPFGYWGFSILGHVLDALYGAHHRIHCLNLGELREGWRARGDRPPLVTSDLPDSTLAKFLLSSGFPSVAFIDEPEDAILAATVFRGMSPRQAIRFSTRCFSSLNEVLLARDLHLIRGDRYYSTVTSVIEELLDIIVGSADPAVVAQVLERVAPDVSTSPLLTVGELILRQAPEAWPPGRKLSEKPPEDQRLIMAVADAYRPIFNRRDLDLLHWPREMFLFSRDFDAEYKAIELLGGARYIVYGPYLCLPRGAWRATVKFEVIENRSGNEMEADVAIGAEVVSRGRFALSAFGVYKFSLDFVVENQNLPIEIRLQILKGAIEGDFNLLNILVELVASAESEQDHGSRDVDGRHALTLTSDRPEGRTTKAELAASLAIRAS